jgi:hypothetical protein
LNDEPARDPHRLFRAMLHSQDHTMVVFGHVQIVGGEFLQVIVGYVGEARRGDGLAGLNQERMALSR